jgi:hypothetical protein
VNLSSCRDIDHRCVVRFHSICCPFAWFVLVLSNDVMPLLSTDSIKREPQTNTIESSHTQFDVHLDEHTKLFMDMCPTSHEQSCQRSDKLDSRMSNQQDNHSSIIDYDFVDSSDLGHLSNVREPSATKESISSHVTMLNNPTEGTFDTF